MNINPIVVHSIDDVEADRDLTKRKLAKLLPAHTEFREYVKSDEFSSAGSAFIQQNVDKHHLFVCDYDLKDGRNAPAIFETIDSLIRAGSLTKDNFSFVGNSSEQSFVDEFSVLRNTRLADNAESILKETWSAIKFAAQIKPINRDGWIAMLRNFGLIS